jgi:hypothetical protein
MLVFDSILRVYVRARREGNANANGFAFSLHVILSEVGVREADAYAVEGPLTGVCRHQPVKAFSPCFMEPKRELLETLMPISRHAGSFDCVVARFADAHFAQDDKYKVASLKMTNNSKMSFAGLHYHRQLRCSLP